MSAVAAPAAFHPAPVPVPGTPGRALQGLPSQYEPLSDDAHPLLLSEGMQRRLRTAVTTLLRLPAMTGPSPSRVARGRREAGATDAERFALLLLAARTMHPSHSRATTSDGTSSPNAGRAVLGAREQGRWMGMSPRAAFEAREQLRERGLLTTESSAAEGERDNDARCTVLPLHAALHRHPGFLPELALTQRELAVLRRVLEYLCAPGWRHATGETPGGLLASREGRGAATDRLAMLLLVLNARRDGTVRLCSGKVDEAGRPAATVARLLGCRPSGGAAVLDRLTAAGAAASLRKRTALRHKARLVVLPLATHLDEKGNGSPTAVPTPATGHLRPVLPAPRQAGSAQPGPQLYAPSPSGSGVPLAEAGDGVVWTGTEEPPEPPFDEPFDEFFDEPPFGEPEFGAPALQTSLEGGEFEGVGAGCVPGESPAEAGVLAALDAEMAEIWAEVLAESPAHGASYVPEPDAFEEQAVDLDETGTSLNNTALSFTTTPSSGTGSCTAPGAGEERHGGFVDVWVPGQLTLLENTAHTENASVADPDVAAYPENPTLAPEKPQVSGAAEGHVADQDAGAPPHAHHPQRVSQVGKGAGIGVGFSGGTPWDDAPRPERARGREEHPATSEPASPALPTAFGAGSPLRGEKPKNTPAPTTSETPNLPLSAPARWETVRQGRPAPLPPGLEEVFAPVLALWQRVSRPGARTKILRTARHELARLEHLLGAEKASAALGTRLARRIDAEDGPQHVREPVAWLLGRGLKRREVCPERLCDDGVRMDSGADCTLCGMRRSDRRDDRRRLAADTDNMMPTVPFEARKAAYEQRLRAETLDRITQKAKRREQQQAESRRAEERAAAARAEQERRPCAECGQPDSDGLCSVCRDTHATDSAIRQAARYAAATHTPQEAETVMSNMTDTIRKEIRHVQQQLLAQEPDASRADLAGLAYTHADIHRSEQRRGALRTLSTSRAAQKEAKTAYDAALRHDTQPDRNEAEITALEAAHHAAMRTAHTLLRQREHDLTPADPAPARTPHADIYAAHRRHQQLTAGLCPEHSSGPSPAGTENQEAGELQELDGPPRGTCETCGARIFLTGPALTDGLCKPCRTSGGKLAPTSLTNAQAAAPQECEESECNRPALPGRAVCLRHRSLQEQRAGRAIAC